MVKPLPFTPIPLGFNSTMVRLKGDALFTPKSSQGSFNSTMVRLKAIYDKHGCRGGRRFNSTMVRLKVLQSIQMIIETPKFQFHNGSIKSSFSAVGQSSSSMFQFHNGSIKRRIVTEGDFNFSFNSTMVRLKGIIPMRQLDSMIMFQFHNGSIKSQNGRNSQHSAKKFQFHNGSIKSQVLPVIVQGTYLFQFHNGSIKRRIAQALFWLYLESFNSTMVRLKGIIEHLESQEGLCFNSTMVRLKEGLPRLKALSNTVSIPQWFD